MPARAGVPVEVEFATTAALVERLTNGEAADLAVLTKEAVQQLAAKGHVRSSTDLVLSVIGIAVADDAPLPAMKTTADFVAFMKAIPSIAYTTRGVSGLHMAKLIEQLGLADVVKPKATRRGRVLRHALARRQSCRGRAADQRAPVHGRQEHRAAAGRNSGADDFHAGGAERRHERRLRPRKSFER